MRAFLSVCVALFLFVGPTVAAAPKKAPTVQANVIAAVKHWQQRHHQAVTPPYREKFNFLKQSGDWAAISETLLNRHGQEEGEYYNFLLRRKAGGWVVVKGYDEGLTPADCHKAGVSVAIAKRLGIKIFDEDLAPGEATEGAPSPKFRTPHRGPHFQILWLNEDAGKYEIVPAIPGGEQNIRKYWPQYVKYGRTALDFMRSRDVQPTKDNVVWWGKKSWPKGRDDAACATARLRT